MIPKILRENYTQLTQLVIPNVLCVDFLSENFIPIENTHLVLQNLDIIDIISFPENLNH